MGSSLTDLLLAGSARDLPARSPEHATVSGHLCGYRAAWMTSRASRVGGVVAGVVGVIAHTARQDFGARSCVR